MLADIELCAPPTDEERAAARERIERDIPSGYSHAARLTLATY